MMAFKNTLSLIIFSLFFIYVPVFAGTPDAPSVNYANTKKLNSSSFSSFVSSMYDLGYQDLYFTQAPAEFNSKIEKKFANKSKNKNDVIKLFEEEMVRNPQFAYNIYNSALLELYAISPRSFTKNSTTLKNLLVIILDEPINPESNITYSNELDCWNEDNYEACKKLYTNKKELWIIPIILAILLM